MAGDITDFHAFVVDFTATFHCVLATADMAGRVVLKHLVQFLVSLETLDLPPSIRPLFVHRLGGCLIDFLWRVVSFPVKILHCVHRDASPRPVSFGNGASDARPGDSFGLCRCDSPRVHDNPHTIIVLTIADSATRFEFLK